MKLFRILMALVAGPLAITASAANTDGTATLTVSLSDPSGNYNKRVDAFWITDSTGKFVQTVRKDAASRQTYLYKWKAAAGSNTAVDGFTGATIGTWGTVTVTWDCRDTNNVIVPDGTYRFYVEMTDYNGQGPWTTNGLSFTKGPSAGSTTYTDMQYIKGMKVDYAPIVTDDIAVSSISPSSVTANSSVNVQVLVTNRTTKAESFSVVLSNMTSSVAIGTKSVSSLPGRGSTNIAFQWTTPSSQGNYTLRATAGPVTGETLVADNTLSSVVAVQTIPHDIAVLSMTPNVAPVNSNAAVLITVTNRTVTAETFSVVLSNLTTGSLIATQQITSLAGNTKTNVTLQWSTTNLSGNYLLQAKAGPVSGEASTADNLLTNVVTVRAMNHNLAISKITAPGWVPLSAANSISVLVTNTGEFAETFSVVLYDKTANSQIGSKTVSNLGVAGSTNIAYTWNTLSSAQGYHALRASAGPIAGETNVFDNTNTASVAVGTGTTNLVYIAKGSTWAYHDEGIDLSQTPWKQPDYYDQTWKTGPAPLGYSSDGIMTNLATLVNWGSDASHRIPTHYFRKTFTADSLPASLTLNVRRCDGVVFYLNGVELVRMNMPSGPIGYTNLAASSVAGDARYVYFSTNVMATNLVLGANELAAEVHLATAASPRKAFDVEMLGAAPLFSRTHDVDALELTSIGDVMAGDNMPIGITLTNRGNATETVQVFLKNTTTGQIVGSQTLANMHPGDAATVEFNWSTFGSIGTNQLVAYTVVNGVTNYAGAFTNSVLISSSGFTSSPVDAAGTIGGRCSAVATTGNTLLVGLGATLEIWDASYPDASVKQAALRLPGLIQSIAANSRGAFVACGNAGVQFIDLTYPAAPAYRKTFKTSGNANGVALNGNSLYVAAGLAGVRVFDVSDSSNPVLTGTYYTKGPAKAVTAANGNVYVIDSQYGLYIFNSSGSGVLSPLGVCSFNAGQAVAVSGGLAYVADGNNGFLAVDVSNPAAPVLRSSSILDGMVGEGVTVNGTTAYVPAGDSGLAIVNIANPAAPVLATVLPTPGQTHAAVMHGSRLFVAQGLAGFQVFDASAALTPTPGSLWSVASRAADVAVKNETAYVAAGEGGLKMFTLTNPTAPSLVGRFAGSTNARCVAISGSTAYVGDGQYGLKIVDVSNPTAPSLLGKYSNTNLGSIRNVGVSGTLVAVSDGLKVLLLNASSAAAPVLVGSYAPPAFSFSMTVTNSRAYLACGNKGVIILGVAANGLSVLGSYAPGDFVSDIAVSGGTAYIACPLSGWRIIDVSAPASIKNVLSISDQNVSSIAVSSNTVSLGKTVGAITMDVSTVLNPVPQRSFGNLVGTMRLATSPTLTLSAEDDAGLAILSTTDDLNRNGISDAWEQQIVNASRAVNGGIRTIMEVRPADDFDGDGTSNLSEYLAGTSPTNSSSVFMASAPTTSGSATTIRWNSVAGKTYTVHRSTDLSAGFSVLQDNIPATAPINSFTDPTGGETKAFYIISVR